MNLQLEPLSSQTSNTQNEITVVAHEIEGERKKEEGRREKREEKEGREKRETVQLYTVHRYSPWSTTVTRVN